MASEEPDEGSGKTGAETVTDVATAGENTIRLGRTIYDVLAGPATAVTGWLATKASRAEAVADYEGSLREWLQEAKEGTRYLQPKLTNDSFNLHLGSQLPIAEPPATSTSCFAWVKLLYALNIRPGDGVLEWERPAKDIQPGTDTVCLIVEGQAMCHIINLFRIYRSPMPRTLSMGHSSNQKDAECELSFGTMKFRPMDEGFVVKFEPATQGALARKKAPFRHDFHYPEFPEFKFKPELVLSKYINCWERGAPMSDHNPIGSAPKQRSGAKFPFDARVEYLEKALLLLESTHKCHSKCRPVCQTEDARHVCTNSCKMRCKRSGELDPSQPTVVTQDWLKAISRIKQRVTTEGGKDDRLVEALVEALGKQKGFSDDAVKLMKRDGRAEGKWEDLVRKVVRSKMLYESGLIELNWVQTMSTGSIFDEELKELIEAHLPSAVKTAIDKGSCSWIERLSGMNKQLANILRIPNTIVNCPVIALELEPGHRFWGSHFEIQG
ncbi:hypothetical protein ISF_03824 [Cordyceps fumosorosea ARSEF 2679]|uniref:Uncharacterized protein n=1 Tax=Cordyceps fumosorosea (strain ARSEF 2679) TaxID=1081104 RepID=A0A167ZL89_CORFA|nr:hypothetical protein ISF_03824 [Cordyceps fumosorosea ARSEF 2679]OAA67648.1 hypothetical protein ISF_03824 [Cordyceps fumosorosea ARSEF 2679]